SGALWGTALHAAAIALASADKDLNSAVANAAGSALEAVKQLGSAKVGDKTMVDAFEPFAQTLRERLREEPLPIAWVSAVDAALDGAAATSALRPKLGRARPLAEKSIGHPDAGA